MIPLRYISYLAFSFLLLMLITGSLLLQTLGHFLDIPLANIYLLTLLPPAFWLTYYRLFPLSRRHIAIALMLSLALALLGIISRHVLDLSADGMGYQQPSAEAILNGWNPFAGETIMLWQNIYPSGVWAVEASLSLLYGSIEDTKMLQIWWLFIALPILLCGLWTYKKTLSWQHIALTVLCVLCPIVLDQVLTHYVDAMVYLSGLTFIGGLLMYGHSPRGNLVSYCIMVACIFFIINAKLSGIYHGVMLCSGALLFIWLKTKRLPFMPLIVLFLAGIVATCIIGNRPYVTSFVQYGASLFPDDTETFSGWQRPSTFDNMHSFERFGYSVFSTTGGIPHQSAQLKWPWVIDASEWEAAGWTDPRTGGFGPLFALGFLSSLGLFVFALIKKMPVDRELTYLGILCLVFSLFFPQSWWARYVPFAYAAPFLLLLALPPQYKVIQRGLCVIIFIFAAGSIIAAGSAYALYNYNQNHFSEVVAELDKAPFGSVYLVPPVANYARYNQANLPLTRRLAKAGIDVTVRIGAPCPHLVEEYSEFRICY